MILPEFPEWQWDIYGKGDDYEELVTMTKQSGIDSQLHFCGQVGDLYERYNQYSFMVMTSRYEGFPMTLLEGMGNGLPLISFDIPTGPNEIITDGENGFLVKENDVETLVNRMKTLIEDGCLREAMSNCSKKRCELFSIDDVLESWGQAINKLLE